MRERAVLAHAHADRLAADRVRAERARHGHLLARHVRFHFAHLGHERLPEVLHHHYPVLLAAANAVELVFKVAGESVVHVLREKLHQEVADNLARVRRREPTAFQFGVLAVHQRVDDGRVGGRTANAIFFQRLHERSFGVARRWLREMLFWADSL